MDALRSRQRFRMAPVTEWVLAAGFLIGIAALGGLVVHSIAASPAPPRTPVVARLLSGTVPAAVPLKAVSVPMLPFQDGKEVRVGDSVAKVATALGRSAEVGRQDVDRGTFGERLSRFYEYGGTRFILVFEPFETQGEARLAAIYLP